MLLGELVEELIAAVGDEGGEVGAVCQLEGQDRRGMAGMQPLQLGTARAYPAGVLRSSEFPPGQPVLAVALQPHLVILQALSLVMAVTGSFLVAVAPS